MSKERRIPWRLIGLVIVLSLVLHAAVLGAVNASLRHFFGSDDPLADTIDIDLTEFTVEELYRLAGLPLPDEMRPTETTTAD